MSVVKQKAYETIIDVVTSGAAIANNSRSAASAAVGADATDAHLLADFELVCTFATAPTLDTTIDLYLVRSADGTNYEDGSDTVRPNPDAFVGSFAVRNVTTSQRIIKRDVPLPPGLWKAILHNNGTGQSISSGWTLKARPHNLQTV